MKPKAAKRGAARLLRRGVAGILALAGVGMAAVAAGLPPLPEQAAAYSVRWDRLRFPPEQMAQRVRAMAEGLSLPAEEA